ERSKPHAALAQPLSAVESEIADVSEPLFLRDGRNAAGRDGQQQQQGFHAAIFSRPSNPSPADGANRCTVDPACPPLSAPQKKLFPSCVRVRLCHPCVNTRRLSRAQINLDRVSVAAPNSVQNYGTRHGSRNCARRKLH